MLVDAALEGLGLAYVFESMVRYRVAEKRLVRVLEKYCPKIPGYFLYYPSRENVAPKLKALVDFIKRGGVRHAARLDLAYEPLALFSASPAEHHRRSALREELRRRAPDAGRRTGHQHDRVR